MFQDEKYMRRCLHLAQFGQGHVAPNPMVGSVIVHNQTIIGEGFHQLYGGPHAEVNAITSVKDPGLLKKSTLYVNLEPCCHSGKTPPCTQLIIEKKIPRVVIGDEDPNPKVAGKGIRQLREAGIEVVDHVLSEDGQKLNKRFYTFHLEKRPYILLKWAQSADRLIDQKREERDGKKPIHFSNDYSQLWVHRMRANESAILVGTNTAILDNPQLTVRHWSGKNPLRVVIDRKGIIPPTSHLLDRTTPTLIYTDELHAPISDLYRVIPSHPDFLSHLLNDLYQQKILSLIVEGGSLLLTSFLQSGLWDETQVEVSPLLLKEGVQAPVCLGHLSNIKKCKQTIIFTYKNNVYPKKT